MYIILFIYIYIHKLNTCLNSGSGDFRRVWAYELNSPSACSRKLEKIRDNSNKNSRKVSR